MKLAREQAGRGFISWTFLLVLIAFVGAFIVKLAPVYIEYFTIRSVLRAIAGDAGSYVSVEEIRQTISRQFTVNDITKVSPPDVVIEPLNSNRYALQLDYERRVPFIYNISFVVNFSATAETRSGGF